MFTDLHCHLLYGIDDGPKEPAGTVALARLLVAVGYGTVATTPHALPAARPDRPISPSVPAASFAPALGLPAPGVPGAVRYWIGATTRSASRAGRIAVQNPDLHAEMPRQIRRRRLSSTSWHA